MCQPTEQTVKLFHVFGRIERGRLRRPTLDSGCRSRAMNPANRRHTSSHERPLAGQVTNERKAHLPGDEHMAAQIKPARAIDATSRGSVALASGPRMV